MHRDMSELNRIQCWMQALIMDPDGVQSALDNAVAADMHPGSEKSLESLVLPSKQLNSLERLSIYGDMYFWRINEILAEEFPTVRHLLGKDLFENVARDYVTRHPSTHYSLTRLGSKFPAYLAGEAADLPDREFVADVATVERAMEDVFDAQNVEPIEFEELTAIPTECWSEVRLQIIPAFRLLKLQHPVNSYITAVREDRHMDIPAAARSFVAVYRNNFRVWRVDLDEQRFELLCALHRGQSLGSALDLCASLPAADPARVMNDVGDWFREWTAEGLFCDARWEAVLSATDVSSC
jgi:hypothetical protein